MSRQMCPKTAQHRISSSGTPKLHILQRWNSFTPILSSEKAPSKGGGYYISAGDVGIVFDPGFDFIQNFRNEGFCFNDIDHIFITHAHNDHTADLESLLSLLHDYNDDIKGHRFSEKENCIYRKLMKMCPTDSEVVLKKKVEDFFKSSPRRKRLHIYVSPGTKEKCGFLKLGGKQEYHLVVLNKEQASFNNSNAELSGGITIKCDEDIERENVVTIFPIPAKHDDLMTDSDCYGYVIQFCSTDKGKQKKVNSALWYTGDTGFNDELEENFCAIKESLCTKDIVLLAHIGGFKPDEQYYFRTNAAKAFYPNHLGRLGLCKLIECINPKVCLVSEFGEEFKNCREQLIRIIEKQYSDNTILPVDVGAIIRFGSEDGADNNFAFAIKGNAKTQRYIAIERIMFKEVLDDKEKVTVIKYKEAEASLP